MSVIPSVYNNEELNETSQKKAKILWEKKMWRKQNCEWAPKILAIIPNKSPACFYRLGVMNEEKGITAGVHTPTFNIDENAIEIGMGMMAWLGSHHRQYS